MANVTVTQATADGNLYLYPADEPTPQEVTPGNFLIRAGKTSAKNAVLELSPDGKIIAHAQMVGSNQTFHLFIDISGYFNNKQAVDDTATVAQDSGPTPIDVLANDLTSGGAFKIASATDPAHGTVVLTGGTPGEHTGLTYQPDPGYCNSQAGGTPDTFSYTLTPAGAEGTVSVTVTCANAPVLTAGGTLNYTEGDPPTAIDTTITVTDPDSTNLQSATVQITGNYQNGADVLSFVNTATITGVFNAATGTLTLTGSDTLANWQTALRSVLYNNTSEDPSTLARTVTWIASDGSVSSAPVTSTINVTAVPDAPVLTAGGALNYTEGDPATAIDTTITVSDVDSANLQSATAQITGNYQNGEDVLSFANTATITGVFNAATGTLTLTGSDTLANWQTALRSVLYNNASDDPSNLARTVTWVASDGTNSSAPVTSTINIGGSPDAPVVTAGGTLNYTEGDPATAIDTGILVTDPDSANLQSATAQITGNYQNGADVLSFTNTATITGVFNAATGTLTLTGTDTVANWQTALRNVLYNNTSEDPSALVRTVTWIADDGANASSPVTSTINVSATADAPVLTAGGTLNYTEGDPATPIDTTIVVSDVDSANLQSATAQITGNYQNGEDVLSFVNTATITGVFNAATGTLTLTGSDTLANWQTALRSVRYNNTSDNPSTAARTVTWIANDGDASSSPVTSTINVATAADAPVLTAGGTLNYTEGDPATAIDTGILVTDPDSANLQSATAQITGNYQSGADVLSFTNTATITGVFNAATGTLTLTGSDTLANWQTALRSVRYNNTSDNPSALSRTVTWIASDGGASSAPVTSTINVTPTNDAPVLTAGGVLSYTEGDPATAIDTTITVIDVDSANLQSATVQITGNYQNSEDVLSFTNTATITGVFNAGTGTLTLTGSDTLANWQTALRSVRYNNTSSNPTTSPRTVTWIANDGGASSLPVTSTINVASVPDAPVLTAGGVLNYTENGPATAIDTTITVTDEDSANLQSATVQITGNYQNGQDVLSFVNTATITGVFNAATGTLTLTGADTLANWQTALRSVRYNNTSENPSTAVRTVTWVASDGGASSSPVTSTINVTAVPDAPSMTAGGTLNYTENDPATAIDSGLTVSDVDSANLQSATVQITNNYVNGQDILSFSNTATISGVFNAAAGTLTLTGTDTVANWQTALRNVRYSNTSDNPSSATRTVTWIVSDGGLSSSPVTSTINVIPVNDAPTPIASPRESFHTIGNTAFEFKAAQSLTPGVWVSGKLLDNFLPDPDGPAALSVSLGTATAGAEVTISSDGSFSYIPPPGATGTDSFTYTVTDGAAPVTRTVTINLVERVWYVRNNAPADGDGQSDEPFDTLAEAQTASGLNDFIFVYFGDGTNLGHTAGIVLKNGQRLLGEHAGLSVPIPAGFNGAGAPGNLGLVDGAEVGEDLRPRIGDAAGNGVSATDAVPLSISGVNVASSTNAINWTTAAGFAGTNTGLTIRDTIVRSAGGKGINILLQGTGALRLAVHDNNLNSTGTALDVQETGIGSLTITAFDDNVVSATTGGTGINVNSATFDATPGGGIDQVSGGATVVGAPGDGVGGAGVVLTSVQGALTFGDLDIFAANGAGLRVSGTGSMSFTVPAGVGIIEATGGPAVDVTATALVLPLQTLESTNSPTTGVALNSLTASSSFSAGSGSSISGITSAAGTAFQAGSNSNSTISYAGTITTTQGKGVDLTSNSGSTISFTGALSLSSGTNPAFNASGGGTVTANNTANTLTTTTGTPLTVTSTNIGSAGLRFQSITSNGAANGVLLNATTGSTGRLVVGPAVGGPCNSVASCAGGAIQNSTGAAISLTNTRNVSFTEMYIVNGGSHGISGTGMTDVTGGAQPTFELKNSFLESPGDGDNESALFFDTLSAANITGRMVVADTTIQNFEDVGIHVGNNSGTLTIDVTNVIINNNSDTNGEEGIDVAAEGTANITLNVSGSSTFTDLEGGGFNVISQNSGVVDINIDGTTITGTGGPDNFPTPPAMTFSAEGTSSTMRFDITNNDILDSSGDGIFIGHEGTIMGRITGNDVSGMATGDALRIDTDATGSSTVTILVDNNRFGNVPGFTGIGDDGIQVLHRDGTKVLNLTITNNQIANTASEGIRYFADDDVSGGGPGNVLRISNNQFSGIGDPNTIVVISQDPGTEVCTNITGNTGVTGITLQQSVSAVLQITQASTAALSTANGGATVTPVGTITFNGSCITPPQPTNP